MMYAVNSGGDIEVLEGREIAELGGNDTREAGCGEAEVLQPAHGAEPRGYRAIVEVVVGQVERDEGPELEKRRVELSSELPVDVDGVSLIVDGLNVLEVQLEDSARGVVAGDATPRAAIGAGPRRKPTFGISKPGFEPQEGSSFGVHARGGNERARHSEGES